MKSINESKILSELCKEFKLKLPKNLETREIYKEIENFKDFEYTYCIAYEMLIRTDEYNSLLSQYDILMDKNNNTPQTEKTVQLDNLITQMNQLGLNQNSFIGFGCGNGNVFEKIKIYDEIANSPWSARTLDKFILTPTSRFESALHQLIVFYHEKNELYMIEDAKAKNKKYIKTSIDSTNALLNHPNIYIPCMDQSSKQTIYKSLSATIYLKELREDFLNILEEKKEKNILKQIKLDSQLTIDFWYKYTLNDVKYGINTLITYYMNNSKIQRVQNTNQDTISFLEVILKPSDFFVPAIDRSSTPHKHSEKEYTINIILKPLAISKSEASKYERKLSLKNNSECTLTKQYTQIEDAGMFESAFSNIKNKKVNYDEFICSLSNKSRKELTPFFTHSISKNIEKLNASWSYKAQTGSINVYYTESELAQIRRNSTQVQSTQNQESSSKSLSKPSESSKSLKGVKRIEDNGKSYNNTKSWLVLCNDDSRKILFKGASGQHWHLNGSTIDMGSKYDSWAVEQVAEYVCKEF